MSEFLYLDGYGAFVWPCYLLTFALLGGLLAWSLNRHGSLKKRVALLEAQTGSAPSKPAQSPEAGLAAQPALATEQNAQSGSASAPVTDPRGA